MKNNNINIEKEWIPRDGYALTLDEIHFLFSEYLNNYSNDNQLIVNEIVKLRSWITNAAFTGERL